MVKEIKTLEEFSQAVGDKKSGFVLIDFYASWCGPCKKIAPEIDLLSQKYKMVSFYKLNIENEDLEKVCHILKISSLPTFCLFNGGNYIANVIGADISKLEQMINENIKAKKINKTA